MSLLDKLEKFKKKESLPEVKKIEVQEAKKISIIDEKIEKEIDWDDINISQDDLWFLYRLKFGKGTRIKRSILLPKFKEVFIRNFNELK